MKNAEKFLNLAWHAYARGKPFLTDDEFDALAKKYAYEHFEEGDLQEKVDHPFPMWSLQKVFDEEPSPIPEGLTTVETHKLDGAAIRLTYEDGILMEAATRGDGKIGEDITTNCYYIEDIPKNISYTGLIQVTGELVCPKTIENARNYASGAIRMKDTERFIKEKAMNLVFIAYGVNPNLNETFTLDMKALDFQGFTTVLDTNYCKSFFRTDGKVIRVDNNNKYDSLGYTAKHPRGAYARKQSSDVAVEETVLTDVIWQVGRTGKITPVAIFDEITIDDAKINRATLNNVGFIEEMELEIGDTILVTRSGGIIPKVLGKI